MKWKRCSRCKDLKPIERFWRKGDSYQSKCIDCMKIEYRENREKKREYDRLRYEKTKREKEENEKEYVCMRCDEFVANVRNNELYWCFHCLFTYQDEWKQKIKVEVINPVIRRSKYYKEKIDAIQQEDGREPDGETS